MFLVLACDAELWENREAPIKCPLLISAFGEGKDHLVREFDRWAWQPNMVSCENHYAQKVWWQMYRPT